MNPSLRELGVSEVLRNISVILPLSAAVWLGSGVGWAATAQRYLEIQRQKPEDAVFITRIALGDEVWRFGLPPRATEELLNPPIQPFEAEDGWLSNLTVDVMNRTDKTIVFAQIAVSFPETGDGRSAATAMATHHITLGRIPRVANFFPSTGEPRPEVNMLEPLSFLPGQTLRLHVRDGGDRIREMLAKLHGPVTFNNVSKCLIGRTGVYFEDGMEWTPYRYSVPDHSVRGRWRAMENGFFPGDPSRYSEMYGRQVIIDRRTQ